jgi:hypothetical protein
MALVASVTLLFPALLTAADNKACKLLTAAELEPVVGGKLSAFKTLSFDGVDECYASTGNVSVRLRWEKKQERASEGPSARAAKQLQTLKEMGAAVDTKNFGSITCSTIVPSKSKQKDGLNTTCLVPKGDELAGVAIIVWTEKDLVPIDKLHPLAEKMAERF